MSPHDVARQEDIRALAQRLANLVDELHELKSEVHELITKVEVMTERGLNRDALMVDVKQDISELKKKTVSHQLTEAEITVLKTIMLGKDRSDWLKQRSKYYFWGAIGFATAIYMLREWIRTALVYLRIIGP